jgi:hypothetical protein
MWWIETLSVDLFNNALFWIIQDWNCKGSLGTPCSSAEGMEESFQLCKAFKLVSTQKINSASDIKGVISTLLELYISNY